MIKKIHSSLLTLGLLAVAVNGLAANMPSCATFAKISEGDSQRLLTVVIDQTTLVDENLIHKFSNIATEAVQASTDVGVYSFSAFSQGKYFTRVFSAKVEAPVSENDRYTLPKKALKIYDRCLAQQKPAVVFQTESKIDDAMHGARADLAKSDIMYSLTQVAKDIRQSQASEKYLLLFSDMLENSAVTSFYFRNKVKKVDIDKEMALVEKAGMFADFGGAKIYVMGAGILSEKGKKKGVYRDPNTLHALNLFWKEWFKRSNAELIEFGMPEMRSSIQ